MKSRIKVSGYTILMSIAAMLTVFMLPPGSIPVGPVTSVEAKTVRTSIAGAEVTGIENKTWTGKKIKQKEIEVKVSGIRLVKGEDYSVSYKHNKNVGTAKVIIKGKNKYKGTITRSFVIYPQTPKLTTAKRSGSSLTIKWKKIKHQVSGYQIAYSGAKLSGAKIRYANIINVGSRNTTSKKFGITKTVERYKVWIRSYKKVGGKTFYSNWSNYLACYKNGSVYRETDD